MVCKSGKERGYRETVYSQQFTTNGYREQRRENGNSKFGVERDVAWRKYVAAGMEETGQELMRHANSRLTLDVYAQALTSAKRAAHLKVVELIRPAAETRFVPLCSHAEEAESVSV